MVSLKDRKKVGSRLTEIRVLLGMSQRGFALKYDLWHSSVAETEAGKRFITYRVLLILLRELKINSNWLLLGEGSMCRLGGLAIIKKIRKQVERKIKKKK